jgi:hypothetical protein
MKATAERLLKDNVFLAGLFILIANDSILKYSFPGLITGKLSDVAGLFVFPFFWSIFFFRYRITIYILTGFGFAFWKTPLSSELITSLNETLGLSLYRTIDYSDLLTLLIMPVSYWHFERQAGRKPSLHLQFVPGLFIVGLSLFSFVATTLPRHVTTLNMPVDTSYVIESGKEEIISRMTPGLPGADSLQDIRNDSLFHLTFFTAEASIFVKTHIHERASGKTTIQLLTIESAVVSGGLFFSSFNKDLKKTEAMNKSDYIKVFEKKAVDHLRKPGRNKQIHYWNDAVYRKANTINR